MTKIININGNITCASSGRSANKSTNVKSNVVPKQIPMQINHLKTHDT
jgi:hypothetical protein